MLAVFAVLGSLKVVGLRNAIKGLFLYSLSVLWDREQCELEELHVTLIIKKIEPRSEKTGLRGFRQGLTQTRLYSYRRWLEG